MLTRKCTFALLFLAIVALAAGCSSDDNPVSVPTTTVGVDSVGVELAPSPLVRWFDVGLDAPAGVQIDYWTEDSDRYRITSDGDSSRHRALVTRLLPRSIYHYEVRAVSPGASPGPEFSGTFTTGSLPPGLMSVHFDAQGRTTTSLTLIELRSDAFNGFVFIDDQGRVVWYWQTEGNPQGSTRRENGNFVFIEVAEFNRLYEVAPWGELIHEVGPGHETVHHDVILSGRNTVFFLTQDATTSVDTGSGTEIWQGDRINEWNPETGVTLVVWDQWNYYDPVADRTSRSRLSDFAHANSLAIGKGGNTILSFNFLNQIVSISPNFRTIEWKLGGIGSDFTLPPEAVFSGQHTASQLENGNVLCFDNRFDAGNADEWSRGLEIAMDEGSGSARVAWSFRPQPDNYARVISSARRLENGNTLVHFGTGGPVAGADTGGPVETYEVTSTGDVVWRLVIDGASSAYRATPYTEIAGEVRVASP